MARASVLICAATGGKFPPYIHTLKVDAKRRSRLPQAEPGQVYSYEDKGEGTLVFLVCRAVPTPFPPAHVRMEKRGGCTVGILDRPISPETLKEALDDFP